MSDNSKIEWLARPGTRPATWNPIRARHKKTGKVGWFCIHASIGCIGCYSEGMNLWVGNGVEFTAQMLDEVEIFPDEKIMQQPLRWRDAHTVFPCSMTDLFGEWVTDEMIDRIFAIMALCPQHTFIVLTKRDERMRGYFGPSAELDGITRDVLVEGEAQSLHQKRTGEDPSMWLAVHWPLPNVWLGVSVEGRKQLPRIDSLRRTPAAIRHISFEPLLEDLGDVDLSGIDWAIIGGHSGKGAKIHELNWSRNLIAQCRPAGVAVFQKQLGSNAWENISPAHVRGFHTKHPKGGDPSEWPEDLRIREFPA